MRVLNNKIKIENINKTTGEILPFRTQFQKSTYNDNEVVQGESMTDTSDYEDINDTIAKCARSGLINELEKAYKLGDSATSFDDYDETQDADYDISQAKQTLDEIREQVQNSSQGEDKQSANEPQTNSDGANGSVQQEMFENTNS